VPPGAEIGSALSADTYRASVQTHSSRTPCYPCFIWSRSGIANSYNDNPAPAQGANASAAAAAIVGKAITYNMNQAILGS
jgi:hypothetical protein